jgi:hypothetical protein
VVKEDTVTPLTCAERNDTVYVRKQGRRKAFHVGSNSSCRQHIRGHYELYKERCAEMGLKENHHAIPREIVRAKAEEKKQKKDGQQKLDGIVRKASQPVEFSREGVLKAVAEFIVCDNQVGDVVVSIMCATLQLNASTSCRAYSWQTRHRSETV